MPRKLRWCPLPLVKVIGAVCPVVICLTAAVSRGQETNWVDAARKFKKTAIAHLEKGRQPGVNQADEGRRALYALGVARRLLENYREPVPDQVKSELQAINSLIYWTYKFTKVPAGLTGAPKIQPTRVDPARSREQQARKHLGRVDAYERANPNSHFVLSALYFEVADRFQGTRASLEAQRKSLEHQRMSGGGGVVRPPGPGRVRPAPGYGVGAEAALEELVSILRTGATDKQKQDACEAYLRRFPGGERHEEIADIAKVYGARSYDDKVNAWIDYLSKYSTGIIAAEARSALSRRELPVRVKLKQHLMAGRTEEFKVLGRVYLKLFPTGIAREVRSLVTIVSAPPGAEQNQAAKRHIRTYSRGTFTDVLKKMLVKWEEEAERVAFQGLLDRFAATRGESELLAALDEYLRAHGGQLGKGAHAKEVKAVRSVYSLDNVRAKLVAARKYLRTYEGGAFVTRVRELERDLARKRETELYHIAKAVCEDGGKPYEAKLAACQRYSDEFGGDVGELPARGRHADEVREMRAKVEALVKEAAAAHKKLVADLVHLKGAGGAAPPTLSTGAAIKLCDEFVRKYSGSAELSDVLSRRSALAKRLRGEKEEVAYKGLTKKLADRGLTRTEKAGEALGFLREHKGGKRTNEVASRLKKLASGPLGLQEGPIRAAAFSADSKFLVACDASARHKGSGLWVWKLPEARLVARYKPRPRFTVRSVALVVTVAGEGGNDDSGELLLGDDSGGLLVWDAAGLARGEARPTGRYRLGAGPLVAVSAPGDGEGFAITASLGDSKARLWSRSDWSLEQNFPCPGGVSAAATSRSGDVVVTGSGDGALTAFDPGTGEELWSAVDAHAGQVDCVVFSPNGMYVASSSSRQGDGTVSLWNASSGERVWSVDDGSRHVVFVDNEYILTGRHLREAGNSHIVATTGGEAPRSGEGRGVGPLAASPDGDFALTVDEEGTGIIWYLPALLW